MVYRSTHLERYLRGLDNNKTAYPIIVIVKHSGQQHFAVFPDVDQKIILLSSIHTLIM